MKRKFLLKEYTNEGEDYEEDNYEDEEGSSTEMYNIIAASFSKREHDLAEYLGDLIVEYKHNEMDYETPYVDYLENEGWDLYDAGSDPVFRFLWQYYQEGLEEAINSEISDEDDFDDILSTCLGICPNINKKVWIKTFKECMANQEEDYEDWDSSSWVSVDNFRESFTSSTGSLKDDIKKIMEEF